MLITTSYGARWNTEEPPSTDLLRTSTKKYLSTKRVDTRINAILNQLNDINSSTQINNKLQKINYLLAGELSERLGESKLAFHFYSSALKIGAEELYQFEYAPKMIISNDPIHRSCKSRQISLATSYDKSIGHIKQAISLKKVVNDLQPTTVENTLLQHSTPVTKNGFQPHEKLIPESACAEILRLASEHDFEQEKLDKHILKYFIDNGLIDKILEFTLATTKHRYVAWRINFFKKEANDNRPSINWHYDDVYPHANPKILIFLNEQSKHLGGTDICPAHISKFITETTGYIGRTWERKLMSKLLAPYSTIGEPFGMNQRGEWTISDKSYYKFTPKNAGDAIIFYPSQCLHRGRNPIAQQRHAISISLTPLHYAIDNIDNPRLTAIDLSKKLVEQNQRNSDLRDVSPLHFFN